MEVFGIDEVPKLVVDIDEDESQVNITTWEIDDDENITEIDLDVTTATHLADNPGRWLWVGTNFTTVPTNGVHRYETSFSGVDFGQEITVKWRWIEYAAERYDGKVYIDFNGGGVAGQGTYVGTKEIPSSNWTDAVAIASRDGINTNNYIVKGNGVLDITMSGCVIEAQQDFRNDSLYLNGQNIDGSTFRHLTMSGEVNGTVFCQTCFLHELTEFDGYIQSSTIINSISVSATGMLEGERSYAFNYDDLYCEIDMQNGAANRVAIGQLDGFVKFLNVAGGAVSVSGILAVEYDSSVLAGYIVTSGTGHGGALADLGKPMISAGEHTWVSNDFLLIVMDYIVPGSVAEVYSSLHQNAGTLGFELDSIYDKLPSKDYLVGSDNATGDIEMDDATGDYPGTVAVVTDVTNPVDANVITMSGESDVVGNIISTYDGSGYTDPNAPAKQSQLDALAITGAAINTSATSVTVTTGDETNSYTDTAALDGTYHQIDTPAGDPNEIDLYYEFTVGGDGVPTSVTWAGRLEEGPPAGNSITAYAYNWGGSSWTQVGTISGVTSSTDRSDTFTLFTSHVGTGANEGKVRIRFYDASLDAAAALYVDQIYVSYAVVNRSVGYALGRIWVDEINGESGTSMFINGVADNASSTWADALSISSSVGLNSFNLAAGTSIVLTESADYFSFFGPEASVDLNGQSIAGAYFDGVALSGEASGTNARLMDCKIFDSSLESCGMGRCAIMGDVTLLSASFYILEGCFSAVDESAPVIDFGAAVGSTRLDMRHWAGSVEFQNMGQSGTDSVHIDGHGEITINANCIGGSVGISGNFIITDNSGGAVTFTRESNFDLYSEIQALPSAADIDSQLSGTHGAGSWEPSGEITVNDADLHDALDSYSNKDNWKADVSNLDTTVSSRAPAGEYNSEIASLSSQIESVQADLDNPDQYKADVSALAIEANVAGHVTSSLNSYDPPTRGELTSDKEEIIGEVNANETKIDAIPTNPMLDTENGSSFGSIPDMAKDSTVAKEASVEGHVTTALGAYDPPTRAELTSDKDEIISEISDITLSGDVEIDESTLHSALDSYTSKDNWKADVSALAIEANVEGHATNALASYDPPTRAEATSDKEEVITQVNANETKIDTMQSDVTEIKNYTNGRWKIDTTTNQMIFYQDDNVTEVARFDLLDEDGNPTSLNPFERQKA